MNNNKKAERENTATDLLMLESFSHQIIPLVSCAVLHMHINLITYTLIVHALTCVIFNTLYLHYMHSV